PTRTPLLSQPGARNGAGRGATAAIGTVPVVLPSERHSWGVLLLSSAKRNKLPLATKRSVGFESGTPRLRSATTLVRAAVPSEDHSSRPTLPSLAAKYNRPLNSTNSDGSEACVLVDTSGVMFFRMCVPEVEPSLVHTSCPVTGSSLSK